MRQTTLERLLELNRGFYQSFAEPFSQTRQRPQPGVLRAVDRLPPQAVVLDLGCGNGELAAELERRGHAAAYVGLDSSEALLELARGRVDRASWHFVQGDLAGEEWPSQAVQAVRAQVRGPGSSQAPKDATESTPPAQPFQQVYAFAVLHHIPSQALRNRLLQQVRALLAPGGRLTLSVWNFLASPRLRQRILPWPEADLTEGEVDPGDYLIDWRRGGRGLRYVHHFTEPELDALAHASGFAMVESYQADGESGVLGRYQAWEIARPA